MALEQAVIGNGIRRTMRVATGMAALLALAVLTGCAQAQDAAQARVSTSSVVLDEPGCRVAERTDTPTLGYGPDIPLTADQQLFCRSSAVASAEGSAQGPLTAETSATLMTVQEANKLTGGAVGEGPKVAADRPVWVVVVHAPREQLTVMPGTKPVEVPPVYSIIYDAYSGWAFAVAIGSDWTS
jgi:hypothetical protein